MAYTSTNVNPAKFHRSQIKIYAYLIPIAVVMILPLVYIFNHAFKPLEELFAFPPRIFVQQPTTENFEKLFGATAGSAIPISRYLFNSILVSVAVVTLTVFLSSLGGFALSKMNYPGKKLLLEINNVALMFVSVAVAIPRYLVVQFLGLTNTYWAHILPLVVMPVGVFLIKQFIDQVPDSLIEAAYIDGAGDFRVYRKIILPLTRPALATVAILSFQSVWNNVETSTMYMENDSIKTLAFYMSTLTTNTNSVAGQGIAAASTLIMLVPNLVLFIILQSRVMNTMANSGIK